VSIGFKNQLVMQALPWNEHAALPVMTSPGIEWDMNPKLHIKFLALYILCKDDFMTNTRSCRIPYFKKCCSSMVGIKNGSGVSADNNHNMENQIMGIYKSNSDNNNDAGSVNFKLSVVTSHTCPLNQSISVHDGRLHKSINYPQFDGTVNVVTCKGLTQFKLLLENFQSHHAFITGQIHQQGEWIESCNLHWDNPELEYFGLGIIDNADDYFRYRSDQPSLICFDIPNAFDTSEVAWEELCRIDPMLNHVGYVVVPYASNAIRDRLTGKHLSSSRGYRFYCLARNGKDITRYGRNFAQRATINGFNDVEQSELTQYTIYQNVNAKLFCPGQIIEEAPASISEQLEQVTDPIEYHPGGLLDTEKFADLNAPEHKAFMNLTVFGHQVPFIF